MDRNIVMMDSSMSRRSSDSSVAEDIDYSSQTPLSQVVRPQQFYYDLDRALENQPELEKADKSLSLNTSINANCENPAFADDLAVISLHPNNLVNRYSYRWKFEVNCSKSSIVVFNNKKRCRPYEFLLGQSYIKQIDSAIHLGIKQDSSLSISSRIAERCQKAKSAFYSMADLGMRFTKI